MCVLKWVRKYQNHSCGEYVARKRLHDRGQVSIASRLYELGFKVKVEASIPREVKSLEEYVASINRNLTSKTRIRPRRGYVIVDILAVKEPPSYRDDAKTLKNKIYLIEVTHRKDLAGDVEKLTSLKVPAKKIIVPIHKETEEVRIIPLKKMLRRFSEGWKRL